MVPIGTKAQRATPLPFLVALDIAIGLGEGVGSGKGVSTGGGAGPGGGALLGASELPGTGALAGALGGSSSLLQVPGMRATGSSQVAVKVMPLPC